MCVLKKGQPRPPEVTQLRTNLSTGVHLCVKYAEKGGGHHGWLRSYNQDSSFSGQTFGFPPFRVSLCERGTEVVLL